MTLPAHRKSVIVHPVSTMDYSVNDDFSMGPKGAQRNPVIVTSSRKLINNQVQLLAGHDYTFQNYQ